MGIKTASDCASTFTFGISVVKSGSRRHVHRLSGNGGIDRHWRRRALGIATDLHKTGRDSFTLTGIGKDKAGGRR
jgi:hypothetical protein